MPNVEKYLKSGGVRCPLCNSTNINSNSRIEANNGCAWQNIKCDNCKGEWINIYTLTGYKDIVIPD